MTLFLGNKHSRYILITAIAVLGIALSILVSLADYYKDEELRQEQFNNAVDNRYFALKNDIHNNMHILESFQALYLSTQDLERSELLERDEFRDFTSHILEGHGTIQVVEWIPRVPDSARKSYESAARREGFPDFQFTERMPPGKLRRAEQRKEYFPIYFVEPFLGNETELGFDLASDTARRALMERAARSGEILATGRITLPGESGNQFGFIAIAPVYRKGALTNTDQARLDNLDGFMLCVFRIKDIVEESTALLEPEGIDFSITDASAPEEERFLYSHASRLRNTPLVNKEQAEAGYQKTKTLGFAGRQWMISYSATPEFFASRDILDHLGLFLAGLAVSGIVAVFLFFSGRHTEQIEKSARELSNTNASLAREMMERQQAEEQLREKEHLLSESQRLGHIGSFRNELSGATQWSDELYHIFGVSPDTFTPTIESFLGLMHPDDRQSMQDWIAACTAGEQPDALDFRIIMPDGTIRFIRGWGEVVRDAEKRPVYQTGIAQDITERKLTEEKIRKQQDLTTKIIETIPLRVFWKDHDLRFLGCNTLFAKDAGFTRPEELIDKTDFEMGWKDQAEMYRADDQRVMDDNIPKLSYDEPQTTPEGGQIWLRTSKVPIHNDMNELIGILGVYEDITAYKKTAQALEESERRFRAILDAAVDGIIQLDVQTHTLHGGNKAICEMLGYSLEELSGLNFEDIHPAKALPEVLLQFERHMKGEIHVAHDLPVQRKDGSIFFADVSTAPMVLGGHQFMVGIFHDVTERKLAEQTAIDERNFSNTLIASQPDIFYVLDPTGRFIRWNDKLRDMLGYSDSQIAAANALDIIHEADRPVVAQKNQEAFEKGTATNVARLVTKTGIRDFSLTAKRVDTVKGAYVIGVGTDITERMQTENKVRQLNEELEAKVLKRTKQLIDAQEDLIRKEKLSLLGQVAGIVGHELRNPLGVMNNAVYFLQTVLTDADETTREYLKIIKDGVDDSERIVADLLDSLRTKPPQPVEVGVRELIEQSLHRVNVPSTITVTLDLPETLPPILVDARQMQQVFRNLIGNGVEAMPEGGMLTIRAVANQSEGTVIVSVGDSGSGITPEILDRLFQPLNTTKARGIGLGLVVVKNLTEANGGAVTVESVVGQGTTFTVVLPTGISAGKES